MQNKFKIVEKKEHLDLSGFMNDLRDYFMEREIPPHVAFFLCVAMTKQTADILEIDWNTAIHDIEQGLVITEKSTNLAN